MMVWIDHVKSDVALNDLGHQPVYVTPASGDRVQNVCAFGAFLKRSFDSFNLPLDAANPIQELVLIANNMCQLDQSPSIAVLRNPFHCLAAAPEPPFAAASFNRCPSQSLSLFGGCPGTTFRRTKSIFHDNIPG